jgi:hypothetical protein
MSSRSRFIAPIVPAGEEKNSGDLVACQDRLMVKAERSIGERLHAPTWKWSDLVCQPKLAAGKVTSAARLKRATALPLEWFAARVHPDSSKSADDQPRLWMWTNEQFTGSREILGIQ